jgi:putative DNA primase/helicase
MSVTADPHELPDKNQPPAFTDEDLALRFAARHACDLRYVASWSKWMIYDGVRWKPDETRRAFNLARGICREASAECNNKSAKALASAKTRAAVITLANDDRRLSATAHQWDADGYALNTPRDPTP